MSDRYDVVVIGSGFGGAVTACRLAESGARVLVLERGRRWQKGDYPRQLGDAWIYQHSQPEKLNGWLDLRFFRGMAVAQGAGVGGGSLTYSSVVMPAKRELFKPPAWVSEINYDELAPHYERAARMLGVTPIPERQHTRRSQLMRSAAEKLGYGDRFTSVPLALSFDPDWTYQLDDPLNVKHSKPFTNPQGQPQGTCVHLGNCDIGCDVRAKNTLDLNYIAEAERHGAEVRPLHLVRGIAPNGNGYTVAFDRIADGTLHPGDVVGERVVLAAGSLGSTELLLRCRDEQRSLPTVSPLLGSSWSPNANFLTPDRYRSRAEVEQGIGPTITAGLDFMDGSVDGQRFYIEDDGFPNVLLNAVDARLRRGRVDLLAWALRRHLRRTVDEKNPLGNVMVWLGEGIDASDGHLALSRKWWRPWRRELDLTWDVAPSRRVIETIVEVHRRLSEAAGGELRVPIWWKLFSGLVTVHPLGGCKMGTSAADGVVDHRGRVFGYPNLYVADGAVLPGATGVNPSHTIAAIAERIAALMTRE